MPNKIKQPWQATSWEELQELVTLDEVRAALYAKEKQRQYHKTQYLKRQEILRKAKEHGLY